LAWQLGRERSFTAFAKHDADGVAPAGNVIWQMLPAGPVLILMDELLNFVGRGRKSGLRDQLFNFRQNPSEETVHETIWMTSAIKTL